jgi:hypothetical protein
LALLAYYFIDLHASYYTAKALASEPTDVKVEEGAHKDMDIVC